MTASRQAEWDRLRAEHLRPREGRPPSSARGVHHVALLSSDVERTIRFYTEVPERLRLRPSSCSLTWSFPFAYAILSMLTQGPAVT